MSSEMTTGVYDKMTDAQKKFQLRANRSQLLTAWLVGGDGGRWEGDDGRVLTLEALRFEKQAIQEAENDKFTALDADYEAAKSAHGLL